MELAIDLCKISNYYAHYCSLLYQYMCDKDLIKIKTMQKLSTMVKLSEKIILWHLPITASDFQSGILCPNLMTVRAVSHKEGIA